MIRKSTWLFLGIFVLLLLVVVLQGTKTIGTSLQQPTATPTAIPGLFDELSSAILVSIHIEPAVGSSYDLNRNPDKLWQINYPGQPPTPADQGTVEQAVSAISSLTPISVLQGEYDLEQLALIRPVFLVRLEKQTGESVTLKLGRQTPTTSGYYAQLNENTPVVVNSFAAEDLMNLLAQPPLQAEPPPASSP